MAIVWAYPFESGGKSKAQELLLGRFDDGRLQPYSLCMLAVPRFLADDDAFGVLLASVFVVMVMGGGAYFIMWLRRRLWSTPEDEAVSGVGFTLGDLRQLHKSGQLSEEEFTKAKEKIVAAARRAAERDAARPKAGPRNPQGGGQ